MGSNPERLSVLLLSHGFPPNSIAGTEQHVHSLVEALRERCDLRVLCRDAGGAEQEQDDIVVRLPPGPKAGSVDELVDPHDAAFEATALRLAEQFKPDLVHVHHWIRLSNGLVHLFAGRGVPVLVTVHDHYPVCARTDLLRWGRVICAGPEEGAACAECLPPPGAAFAGESFAHRLTRIVRSRIGARAGVRRWVRARAQEVFRARLEHMRSELECAAAVICPSVALKREMTLVWPQLEPHLTVLEHGVETAWGAMVRRQPAERVRFAYVGTVTPHKGIEVLLEAFRQVDGRRATLAIHGAWASPDAAFRQRIADTAAQFGVTLHGPYEQSDLPAIYSEVDVAVVPSTCKESASLAVREAFVAGVPVIASDLGALPEAVEHTGNGLLVRPGDAEDLAQKMGSLAEDRALLARLSDNIRPPKSMTQYATEIAAIYDELARRGGHDYSAC